MIAMLPIINARPKGSRHSKRTLHIYDGQRRLWMDDNVIGASDPTSRDSRSAIGHSKPNMSVEFDTNWAATMSSTIANAMNSERHDTNGNKCAVCRREFPLRKTMLRHLRTVHAPKDLTCSTCGKTFIRQDNLSRHIAEQHSSDDRFTKCDMCGRRVSKRGLPEHMASRICKASQNPSIAETSNELLHLYVEDEDDCFLLTMRVLKLWLPLAKKQVQSGSLAGESNSQDTASSKSYRECMYLGARALDSMRSQMQDHAKVTKCLRFFCTAVLWACISLIGVQVTERAPAGFQDWDAHLKGASVLLKVFHQSICDCDKYLLCQKLQRRANQDPALCLLKKIVRDAGLVGILLNVLPSLVRTWENSIQLLDVLLKCIVSQIGQNGNEFTNWQSFCEANNISFDNERSRGLEAMIWPVLRVSSEDQARSTAP